MSPDDPVADYLHLTRTLLPQAARSPGKDWPVTSDHCFQRIVLDNIVGGVWYDHIAKPAYRNLTPEQARAAVTLARDILTEAADIWALNDKSLEWRGKSRAIRTRPAS